MVEDLRSMYAFSFRHIDMQYSATKWQARYSFFKPFFFFKWSIVALGLPGGSDSKFTLHEGDIGSIPELGRSG